MTLDLLKASVTVYFPDSLLIVSVPPPSLLVPLAFLNFLNINILQGPGPFSQPVSFSDPTEHQGVGSHLGAGRLSVSISASLPLLGSHSHLLFISSTAV